MGLGLEVRLRRVADVVPVQQQLGGLLLRGLELYKLPGVAETLDWARALDFLGAERMDANVTTATLGSVLKDRDDIDQVKNNMSGVIG